MTKYRLFPLIYDYNYDHYQPTAPPLDYPHPQISPISTSSRIPFFSAFWRCFAGLGNRLIDGLFFFFSFSRKAILMLISSSTSPLFTSFDFSIPSSSEASSYSEVGLDLCIMTVGSWGVESGWGEGFTLKKGSWLMPRLALMKSGMRFFCFFLMIL